MELTLAERRRSLPKSPPGQEGQGNQGPLLPDPLTSLADHHLVSTFHDNASGFQTIRGAHVSFMETPIGAATLVLSRYPIGKQRHFAGLPYEKTLSLLQKAREAIENGNGNRDAMSDDGCEVLYGRAGYLYALLYLRGTWRKTEKQQIHSGSTDENGSGDEIYRDLESCRALFSDAVLGEIIQSIIQRGRYGAQAYSSDSGDNNKPPLMWSWHGKRYLGGAHGVGKSCHLPALRNHV